MDMQDESSEDEQFIDSKVTVSRKKFMDYLKHTG